ncbi:MAG: amidohydrolase [Acidobacteriota bacterium]
MRSARPWSAGALRPLVAAAILGALVCAGCSRQATSEEVAVPPGEIVVFSGPRFWTGEPARPWADGLAVRDGRIVALLERHEIARLVAQGAEDVRLPGEVALPGLVDGHGHLLGYGLARRSVDLVGADSLEQTLARVAAWARSHPDASWVLGRGWDQNDWPRKAFPDADRLDQVVPDRPCALRRIDGHALWVNRAALAAAGIDARTPDPAGGQILRDRTGRPTGILVDSAMDLVDRVVPEPDDAAVRRALEDAVASLSAFGLTGFHDMGTDGRTLAIIREMDAAGRLPLRLTLYASADDEELVARLMRDGPEQGRRFRVVGVKFYADGALGSRGARLLAPYNDQPDHLGLFVTDPTELRSRVLETMRAGLQPAVHAIGDAANRLVLEIYASGLRELLAAGRTSSLALRPRIEHAQVIAPPDIPRFRSIVDDALAAAGAAEALRRHVAIVASMQPSHATSDMPWAERRLGPARLRGAYAWRSLIDAGVPLVFGSDVPVESADPRTGLYAAVTRTDPRGLPPGGWLPAERVPLERAVRAYTLGAAFAAGRERDEGTLAPGKRCDLTVLRVDPFGNPPRTLLDDPVLATVVDGQVTWRAPAPPPEQAATK